MKKNLLIAAFVFLSTCTVHAQNIDLGKLLDKAFQATRQYQETFKNLIAEEFKTYETFRKDEKLDESRKIKSTFVVYQSPNRDSVGEFRNVLEYNGKNVARKEEDLIKFLEKLTKSGSTQDEVRRLIEEGSRFDGNSHAYGLTLGEGFVLRPAIRSFFDFTVVSEDKVAGRRVLVVEYKQARPTGMIKVNATDEENKNDPQGFSFDTYLPANFRPTNPRIQGKLWLDAETAQLWRNEYTVSIQPAVLTKPVVTSNCAYEYQSSEYGILLPKKFWIVTYSISGKTESDMVRSKVMTKSFEYSNFSRPSSDIKETTIGN